MRKQKPKTPRQQALALLARREYTVAQMRHKLLLKEHPVADVETTLAALVAQGWLSQTRFTDIYIRARRSAGVGPLKLQYELKHKGVDDAIVHDSEEWQTTDWLAHAKSVLQKKYKQVPMDGHLESQKRARFLVTRGFSMEVAWKAVSEIYLRGESDEVTSP